MKRNRTAVALACAAGLLAGCATAPWDADAGAARRGAEPARQEYAGVVERVREVEIPSPRSGVGPMVGTVIGGTVGSRAGHGRGASAGVVIGTVIGGVAGEAAAQAATERGVEITVKLDDGRVVAVTQSAGEVFQPGERVRVVSDGGTARVMKAVSGER